MPVCLGCQKSLRLPASDIQNATRSYDKPSQISVSFSGKESVGMNFRPHYLAPLKELCNRKFKSRFIAELEGNGSARAVGHQERVLVESLEVLNHDLLQMRGIVCGWE